MKNKENKKNLIPTEEVPAVPQLNLENKEEGIKTMYKKGENK
ncbi:hypothetical protein [Bacillus suaedaesalsae]|nr:hypothetical protein [Bacillus suaedaesalsae]